VDDQRDRHIINCRQRHSLLNYYQRLERIVDNRSRGRGGLMVFALDPAREARCRLC
jgi:hypothetical protein